MEKNIKDTKDKFPTVSAELLKELDRLYPERSPLSPESFDQLRWRGGQRDVVRFLHSVYERQNSNLVR